MHAMTIGQVAKQAGVGVETVRFYELFLGLVGFVTPCSLAVNLIFLGYIRGKPGAVRLTRGAIFTLTRDSGLWSLV